MLNRIKNILAYILIAAMLVSCGTPDPGPEDTGYLHPMDDFEVIHTDNYLSTSLRETAQISEFRNAQDCGMWTTAPMVQIVGDRTYVMRRFPAEIIGLENIHRFDAAETSGDYVNQIEIYTDGDYSVPSEVITLTGHAGRMLRFDEFEYLPESDTFVTLQSHYYIDDPDVLTIRTFDREGKMMTEKDIVPPNLDFEDNILIDKRLMGGDLYYVKQETTVYRYDIDTDTETIVNGGVNGFTVSDGKLVYLRHAVNDDYEMEYRVCEYDPEQGLSFVLGKLACNFQEQQISTNVWMEIAYDRENRILYYDPKVSSASLPAGIRAARLNDEEFVQVLATSERIQFIKRLEITGGQLLVQVGNNQILLYEVPDTPAALDVDAQELNFCLYSPYLTTAENYMASTFRIMEMSGTQAKAHGTLLLADPDEYAFTMAKKLLAGDTDFDIFIVTNEMAELLKEGYYEDLSEYRLIDRAFDSMIPGVKELCTLGDALSLCPISLHTDMLCADNSLLESELNTPSTFAQLVSIADTIPLNGDDVRLIRGYTHLWLVRPWFRQYAANFMAATVDDTRAKEDLVTLYRNAWDLLSGKSVVYGEEVSEYKAVFDVRTNSGKLSGPPEGTSVYPIFPVAEGYGQAFEGTFYAVNPNSPNKELAAEFLTCYLEVDWMKNGTLYDVWDENTTYTPGGEMTYALLKEQIADSVIAWTIPDLDKRVGSHLNSIAEGCLTPEDAADDLFRYLKMIRDE